MASGGFWGDIRLEPLAAAHYFILYSHARGPECDAHARACKSQLALRLLCQLPFEWRRLLLLGSIGLNSTFCTSSTGSHKQFVGWIVFNYKAAECDNCKRAWCIAVSKSERYRFVVMKACTTQCSLPVLLFWSGCVSFFCLHHKSTESIIHFAEHVGKWLCLCIWPLQ